MCSEVGSTGLLGRKQHVITFFTCFYFCLKLKLNTLIMKQGKEIQNKLDGLGTFEGEQREELFFPAAFVFSA